MIGTIISHYKILEKLGKGGMSLARTTAERANFVRSGGENQPRTLFASGCDFQDPPSSWRRRV